MVNNFYGILRGDQNISQACPGFRYSDRGPISDKQRRILGALLPKKEEEAAVFIDYILKLLSCSPYWPEMIRSLDINNTYDVSSVSGEATLSFDPMARLIKWEAGTSIRDDRIPYSPEDPVIDRLCAKLFAVFLLGDADGANY